MPDEKPKRTRRPKDAKATEKPMRPGPNGGALKTGPSAKPPKEIPNAPQEGRPGHNGGGWLKSGNTVNVGRKPSEIRADILATVGEATAVMRSILDGEFKIEIRDMFGNVVGYRTANIAEFTKAYDALAKHALPTKTELSGPDGGAIPMDHGAGSDDWLDGLSLEDYEAYKAIAERAHASSQPQ